MPYQRLPENLKGLCFVSWYDLNKLGPDLKAIRKINYSIVEQRQQSLQRLGNLADECPFNLNVRFPVNGIYVCEASGDWSRKFQQLKSSLSYKALNKDEKNKGAVEHADRDYNDAQVAFWNSTTAMLDQIARMDGVWTRVTFETYHGLTWGEEAAGGGGLPPAPPAAS